MYFYEQYEWERELNVRREVPQNMDLLSEDKQYWAGLFANVDHDPGTVTLIRRMRYTYRKWHDTKFKMEDPVEDYGPKLGRIIRARLDRLISEEHLDCVDNERWARCRKRKELRRYRAVMDTGCCGSRDVKVPIKVGIFFEPEYFLLGCNYGH